MRPGRRLSAVVLAFAAWAVAAAQEAEEPPQPRIEPSVEAAATPAPSQDAIVKKSLVTYALLPSSVGGGVVREGMVRRMVDAVVMAAAGKADIASAWRVFVAPTDRVGIKVSTTGAPASSTRAAVVSAVAAGLVASGVPKENIVIWDRLERDMARAGYDAIARSFRVTSTDRVGGYDKNAPIIAAVMGRLIADDLKFSGKDNEEMSSTSHLSLVLTGVDKVVHVPALADSMFSGVQGALSGMVLDNLDNWRRLARPPHFGDPYLPELYADPRIGGKVVLTILDALRPQYAGGPFPGPEFSVNYGAILASRDPVALDTIGVRVIDDFRKEAKFDPVSKMATWLESAQTLGLGRASESEIEIIRTGLEGEVHMEGAKP